MPHYHRRWCVSLPSSGWDRVGPHRYGRQGRGADRANLRGSSIGSGCDECLILRAKTCHRGENRGQSALSSLIGVHFHLRQQRKCTLAPAASEASWGYMVKPHGSLVRVSSMHCCTSTPRLSTSWSSRVLQGACAPGDLILVRASRLDAFSGYRFRT
jgi:hypothetical protein